jgi:glycosyltransferase involved in cell wall biosynthesis
LNKKLAEQRPDVVISMFSHYNLRMGTALVVRESPAWIARIANDPVSDEQMISRVWGKLVYHRARLIVANSLGLLDGFRRHYRIPDWPVQYLPNPVDFESISGSAKTRPRFTLPPAPLIVAVGRLCEQKRYDILLQAFQQLSKEADAHLLILGDGPLRRKLGDLVSNMSLNENVTMTGHIPNPYAIIARANLFVMSSDHEGSPNSLIEAQGLGIPAVSTDCPYGPAEIIENGKTGFLVPVGDVSALCVHMSRILQDSSLSKEMGKSAKLRAHALFGSRTVISLWENTIEQVANMANGTSRH